MKRNNRKHARTVLQQRVVDMIQRHTDYRPRAQTAGPDETAARELTLKHQLIRHWLRA